MSELLCIICRQSFVKGEPHRCPPLPLRYPIPGHCPQCQAPLMYYADRPDAPPPRALCATCRRHRPPPRKKG